MTYRNQATVAGIIYIIFGLLCIIFRGGIISFAAFCAGIALIVFGIVQLVNELVISGTIMLVFGIAILFAGWFMISMIFYMIAIAMIVVGIFKLVEFFKKRAVNDSILRPEGLRPILLTLCGVVFLFNQRGTVSVVFIIVGILLIIAGILSIVENN